MSGERIGVGIISFDRPHYLRQLVRSLEANGDLKGVDFHLFQDGAVNRWSGRLCGSGPGIMAAVSLFKASGLRRKTVHVHLDNVGIALNQHRALEYLVMRYPWVVLLENDVVLSPHYLRLARVLFEQLEAESNVCSFCLGFKKLCPRHRVADNLDKMIRVCGHWWGEGLWSNKWARARPFFDEYYHLVADCDYQARPHEAITGLFRAHGWPSINTTQDAAKDMAIYSAGMERVRLVVNRGISIGRHGTHSTPALYRGLGFDDQEPYVFESDAVLDRFQWSR